MHIKHYRKRFYKQAILFQASPFSGSSCTAVEKASNALSILRACITQLQRGKHQTSFITFMLKYKNTYIYKDRWRNALTCAHTCIAGKERRKQYEMKQQYEMKKFQIGQKLGKIMFIKI